MKRILTFLIIAGCITLQVAALDFGVNLSNTTGLNGINKSFNVVQINAAEAFIEFPVGGFSSIYISGEARFLGIFPIKPKGKAQLISPIEAFRLKRTEWTGNTAFNTLGLQWAIGRTSFNDYSKNILNGLFDGAKVGLTIKNADIAFALGYTGLTYKTDAKIRIDQDDIAGMNNTNKILAPQRLFLLLSSSFQELIPWHTFGFEALTQFDVLKNPYAIPYTIYSRTNREECQLEILGCCSIRSRSAIFLLPRIRTFCALL